MQIHLCQDLHHEELKLQNDFPAPLVSADVSRIDIAEEEREEEVVRD